MVFLDAQAHLSNLPAMFPKELCQHHHIFAIFAAFKTSHACSESTLRQDEFCRNGKIGLTCEETVEDETFLWKVGEKSVSGSQLPVLSWW
jgi:hypothetical protein